MCVGGECVPGKEPAPGTNNHLGLTWKDALVTQGLFGAGAGVASGPSSFSALSQNPLESAEKRGLPEADPELWGMSNPDAWPGQCCVGDAVGPCCVWAHSKSEKCWALGGDRRTRAEPQMGPDGWRGHMRPLGSMDRSRGSGTGRTWEVVSLEIDKLGLL